MNMIARHFIKTFENKDLLDKSTIVVGVLGPFMTLPQVIQIWTTQSAEGVSLATWSFYIFISLVWVVYGVKKKILPIIVADSLWVVFELMIVVGILLYS